MLREGALVVLGTLVPVDVRHNALLMVRFFVYIAEALAGRLPENSLEAVWHHTLVSNAVNDVVSGNRNLERWARAGARGTTVVEEFMLRRSRGRLRGSHVYDDTEAILIAMARERGMEAKMRAWLVNPGYLPESLCYVALGWPERIVFHDAEFERADARFGRRVRAWVDRIVPTRADS